MPPPPLLSRKDAPRIADTSHPTYSPTKIHVTLMQPTSSPSPPHNCKLHFAIDPSLLLQILFYLRPRAYTLVLKLPSRPRYVFPSSASSFILSFFFSWFSSPPSHPHSYASSNSPSIQPPLTRPPAQTANSQHMRKS